MIATSTRAALPNAVARSLRVFPGGSNGGFALPAELSLVIRHGQGCELWDTAGNLFIDFSMGWGSALVGHARREVDNAVTKQIGHGANFAYVTDTSLALAEEICGLSPSCDQLRFCASGTEATLYCLRLARAFTGRTKVLKFEGAYHGAHDTGITNLFPQRRIDFPTADPSSAGVTRSSTEETLIAPYNDALYASHLIEEHAGTLAAVIVEPLQRCTAPTSGFLESLSAACISNDVLLIFDEVVTGFRLAYGGAQAYYRVVPDLVAYGKALGGGYPIGAFGGRQDIMALMREQRSADPRFVWMASTLGGNPISTSAALATLEVLRKPGTYQHLHAVGHYLRDQMRAVLEDRGECAQVIGDGPLAQVVFTTEPVHDYRATLRADQVRGRALMLALFERGVFLNPMGTKLYLSLAHSEETCDRFIEHFADALDEIGDATIRPGAPSPDYS